MSLDTYLEQVKALFTPKGNVSEQAVKSGVWVTLTNVFDRILQLFKLAILAHLLLPSDFGLLGIALLTLGGLKRFSTLGIASALIQRKENNVDEYLNTAWCMKAFRGAVIVGVAFVLAPYAAQFFNESRVTPIIRVIAISPLITSLQNPGMVYLQKNLEFHKQFVFTLSSTLADVVVAVVTAVILQNVWALVYGILAGSVVKLLISYIIHDYRPKPEFHRRFAIDIIDFGKWILGSEIVLFLIMEGDDAFVGWFLGATALGFYQISYRFSNAPATEVTQVISKIMFPTYSKIQTDSGKLQDAFYSTVQLTTVVAFPMAAGIIIVAPIFVEGVLGSQWKPAIPAMQVLALWGGLRSLGATTGPLFNAVGRPDLATKIQFGKLIIIAITIYPLTAKFGFTGTAIAIVGNSLIFSEPVSSYIAVRTVNGDYQRFIEIIIYPFLGSIIMSVAVWITKNSIKLSSQILELFILVFVGVIIYFAAIAVMDEFSDYNLRGNIQRIIHAIK